MSAPNFVLVPNAAQAGSQSRNALSYQIDELIRLSDEERKKKLGEDWFGEVQDLYEVNEASTSAPSFRPKVVIPQLQTLILNEATDLTDTDPKVIITKGGSERDKDREEAFMAQWIDGGWSDEIMLAELWALFSCIGYIQIGYDRNANNGQGQVWVRHRDPATVHPDPAAKCDEDWSYLVYEDKMYLDRVRMLWPEQGYKVKARFTTNEQSPIGQQSPYGFQMPPGPMSAIPGLPSQGQPSSDGQVIVRTLLCKDPTLRQENGKYYPKYPNGRMVVDCEGVILFDGDNPFPYGEFNLVSFVAMPRLGHFYPPSATKYSITLQKLAEKMYTQCYENMVRTNNLITIVNAQSGINIDNFGGLPAEVHVADLSQGDAIKQYGPQALPAQAFQLPQQLLEYQKSVQGFTPARSGEPSQGNVSSGLYDLSIVQSQKLTRMRGRLMARSISRVAKIAFCTMAKYYVVNRKYPVFQQDAEAKLVEWNQTNGNYQNYNISLDPGSIRSVSGAMMRMMAPMLKQAGMIGTEEALTALEWPNAKEVAQEAENELRLAALASAKKK